MILAADENFSGGRLLLKVAAKAQVGIARYQHLLVYGTVNGMAGRASFPNGFMFKNERAGLCRMTLGTSLVLRRQSCASSFNGRSFVRVMTISATHFPFHNWMMVGQIKLTPLVQVALETDFWRSFRVNNCMSRATALVVDAPGPVTGFAADIFCVLSCGLQTGVSGRMKISNDVGVTFFAALGPGEFGAGNLGWRNNCASGRGAGNDYQGKKKTNEKQPEPLMRAQ